MNEMRKTIWIISLASTLSGAGYGQLKISQADPTKVRQPEKHYVTEYLYDVTTDSMRWTQENPGLNAAFGTTDELYLRCENRLRVCRTLKLWLKERISRSQNKYAWSVESSCSA